MDKWIQQQRDDANARASEVIAKLQEALHAIPPFQLADGTEARVEPYAPIEPNRDGQLACGVDVLLKGEGHLEFMLTNTGWGRVIARKRSGPQNGSSGRGR